MAKLDEVGRCFDRTGFENERVQKRDKAVRFRITAIHQKRNVRVVITGLRSSRHTIIHFMDGACNPIRGYKPICKVMNVGYIEKILQAIHKGEFVPKKIAA